MSDETKSKVFEFLVNAIEKLGYPIVISCILMWMGMEQMRAAQEESRSDRAYIRGELHTLVQSTTEAVTQGNVAIIASTNALTKTNEALQEMTRVLDAKREVLLRIEQKLDQGSK